MAEAGEGMLMGVVADDVTGANDIGIMFAKGGCVTDVYSFEEGGGPAWEGPGEKPQIVILDTNSRLDPPDVAYRKVWSATKTLAQAGCRRFFNKTCSVFRGNIGPEFDAMLDALGRDFAVVVLGFPKNGRTTVAGIHYVHGRRLEESEFRNDPIHPMTRSDLVGILQAQTRRPVGLIDHRIVGQGPAALRREVEARRPRGGYLILDVVDQNTLAVIAQALPDEPVLCGSSALAEELPAAWGVVPQRNGVSVLPAPPGLGIPVAAGSLMPQTDAQVSFLKDKGVPLFCLDSRLVIDEAERQREIDRLAAAVADCLCRGLDVLYRTASDPGVIEETRRRGEARGLTRTESSRLVSEAVAEVTARVLAASGQNRLVVAGGETAAAVCRRLGVKGMRIWREIQPGLPSCLALTEPPRLLVLKSGSFGRPDFFAHALSHLRQA